MAAVADAAGFGSVRRFNDTFRKLYRRSPRELRRRAPAALSSVTLRLGYRAPYDWDAIPRLPRRAVHRGSRAGGERPLRPHHRDRRRLRQHPSSDPARGHLLATIRFPRVAALLAIVARPQASLRSRRRHPGHRRASVRRQRAGAPDRAPPGPAHARRLVRLRTRGARHPRPADHRRRRPPPRGEDRGARRLRHRAGAQRRRASRARLPVGRASGARRSLRARHAQGAHRGARCARRSRRRRSEADRAGGLV